MEKREIPSEKLRNMNADAKCVRSPTPSENRIFEKGFPKSNRMVKRDSGGRIWNWEFGDLQASNINQNTRRASTWFRRSDDDAICTNDAIPIPIRPSHRFHTLPRVIHTCVTRSHLKLVEI